MKDLFLIFPSAQVMRSVLRSTGLTYFTDPNEEGGEPIEYVSTASLQYSLWEVGEITGSDGWHVNLRIIDTEFDVSFLEPYRAFPSTPYCTWA